MARIFLCHANEEEAQVEKLDNRLRNLGFEPWMDEQDLTRTVTESPVWVVVFCISLTTVCRESSW
jgi:hypothetical protein